MGGLARRASFIKTKSKASCRVFAGDMIRGPGQYEQEKADLLLRFLSAMNYDAVAPGEMDLSLGTAFWRERARRFPFFVCANVYDAQQGKLLFRPWLLKKVKLGGARTFRLAITGVLSAEYWPMPALPAQTQAELVVRDYVDALRQLVPKMRREADLVVVLAHVGDAKAKELAQALQDIDLIVAGHTAGVTIPQAPQMGAPVLVSNGYLGKIVGEVVFRFDDNRKRIGQEARQTGLSEDTPEDKEFADAVRDFKQKWAAQPFAAVAPPVSGPFFAGAPTCQSCHRAQHEQWRKTPHARALEPLVRSKGATDASNPECLRCHTLGYGKPQGFTAANQVSALLYGSVQCEHCHGAGSAHVRQPTEKGKVVRAPSEQACVSCHDKVRDPKFDYSKKLPLVSH
jgi:hypothetical protein